MNLDDSCQASLMYLIEKILNICNTENNDQFVSSIHDGLVGTKGTLGTSLTGSMILKSTQKEKELVDMIEKFESENEELKGKVSDLDKENKDVSSKLADYKTELERKNEEISRLR